MRKNKQKTEDKKVVYYSDPLNDDFAGTNIKTKTVSSNFKLVHKSILWHFFSDVVYYLIAIPLIWVYERVFLRIKIVNKKNLRKYKGPCFFYCNHSHHTDALAINLVGFPRRTQIVASADAVSIKGIKTLVQMLGAVPVPTDMAGMKNFTKALDYYHKRGNNIAIYPEAHIWPYYTGIRPFLDSSFGYAVSLNSPVIAVYTAHSQPKGLFARWRKTNMTLYVSEPFYPNSNISKKEAKADLRNRVYDWLVSCSKQYSSFEAVEYRPLEQAAEETDNKVLEKSADKATSQ